MAVFVSSKTRSTISLYWFSGEAAVPLPKTNSKFAPENRPKRNRKRERLPTIHFSGAKMLLVSGRVNFRGVFPRRVWYLDCMKRPKDPRYLHSPPKKTNMEPGNTPPKFKITPEKWWLEDDFFSYWVSVTFQGRIVKLLGVHKRLQKGKDWSPNHHGSEGRC